MAYFKFKLNEKVIEWKKTDFHAARSDLFAIIQMPKAEFEKVEFFINEKKSSFDGVQCEIDNLIDKQMAKKMLTHKKIYVGDGVTHLRKKAIWIRK